MIYYRRLPKDYFKKLNPKIIPLKNRGKKMLRYYYLHMGFDIETTNLPDVKKAYMYIWQMSINDDIILGRKWVEFLNILKNLEADLCLRTSTRVIIWVANLGFEFQFIRKYLNITKIFAKEKRQPLYFVHDECIEFRDALQISGGSLASLAKQYTKTQKLKGDLDYTILRNNKTKLTKQELLYCINDVKILSEYSKYIFDTYIIPDKFIPLTKTGLLRRQVKKAMPKLAKTMIYQCYPTNYDIYSYMMKWCFQGGLTHANRVYSGKVLKDTHGVDITSSYPSQMLNGLYPVSPFKKVNEIDYDKCCLIDVTLYDIYVTTTHSIISKSKCIVCYNAIIDNGRILKADEIRVFITEIDYKLYKMYYSWERENIHSISAANKGYLPKYLLQPMIDAYIKKTELKRKGLSGSKEYAEQKSYVNSCYGMTVTRLCESEIDYINDEWVADTSTFDYESEKEKAFLLPQWGIYVTAYARQALLSVIYEMADDVIYYDTDSIKFKNLDNLKFIEKYNKCQQEKMKKTCERLNLPYDIFYDLGSYDVEYTHAEKFKTLGAKRYIYTINGTDIVTIAGLPKNTLQNYCNEKNLDIYDVFNDKMLMSVDVSGKLTTAYNDKMHTDVINGIKMCEQSSVCLYSIPFKMSLDKFYAVLIQNQFEEGEKYEKRDTI